MGLLSGGNRSRLEDPMTRERLQTLPLEERAARPRSAGAEEPGIPPRYNETRAVLMVRDPHWAYAYWDVEDAQAARVRRDAGFEQLVLRVQDLQPASSFDIPIQWSDSSWYIYLPNQDADYQLELGYLASGKFRLLARSNQVRTPRESIAGDAPQESESLFLGGSPEAFAGPSSAMSSEAIPQRILSALRE